MAALTGNKIKDSYLGLLKSIDNAAFAPRVAGTFVQVSDGGGNGLPLYLSATSIRFHDAYTFPSADGTANQVLSTDGAGNITFTESSDNQTLEEVLTSGNTSTLAILSTASGNTFGSTTFSGVATLANDSVVTGTPPTASDNSTKIATTAYVDNQVSTGGTVKKTGTIAQNAIAVWNNTLDTLRSDDAMSIATDGTITLYQPNNVPTDKKNYNIGGGNIALNTDGFNTGFGEGNLSQVGFVGSNNSAFGYQSSFSMTTGDNNTSVGFSSLLSETVGTDNTAIGHYSLFYSNNGNYNTSIGSYSLYTNSSGGQNVALGYEALRDNTTSSHNTALGYRALKLSTGDHNLGVGYNSGNLITSGTNNVVLGSFSGYRAASPTVLEYDIRTTSNNIVISDGAGTVYQSFDNSGSVRLHTYGINAHTGTLTKTLGVDSNGNVIEFDAAGGDVNISGTPVANQIAIWTDASTIKGDATFTIDANHEITLYQPNGDDPIVVTNSYNIGGGNISTTTGASNTGFGKDNLSSITSGGTNVAIGYSSLNSLTEGGNNTSIGAYNLDSLTTGSANTAIGGFALRNTTTGFNNTAIGFAVMNNNSFEGEGNVAIGNSSGIGLTTGDYNIFLGYNSGNAMTTGSKNVIIGGFSGFRAAATGVTEYDIIASSNNIVLSDGDGNVRQSFDSNGAASFSGAATFSGNVEIDTNGGDGALGGTLKLSSTNTNVSARNWALINTWDNYGDLTFRVGNAQGDNPLTSGSTKLVITSGGAATFNGSVSVNGIGLNSSFRLNNTTATTGTDWHIYSLNGGNFGVYNNTASSYALQISSGGDVKIGDSTTDVTSKLTVSGNGSVNTATFMYDGNAGTYFDIDTEAADGSVILSADARSGNYPPMLFKTGGSTRLTISSGGAATFSGDIIRKGNVGNISFEGASVTNINAQIQYDQVNNTTGQLFFKTANGSETLATRLTISSGGDVGIGVTPSAWISTAKVLQLGNTAALFAPSNEAILSNNVYVNSSDQNIYLTNNFATEYRQVDGKHIFYTAASGTGGNTIPFSPKLTITSGGTVEVNSGNELRVYRSDNARYGTFYTDSSYVHIAASTDPIKISSPSRLEFHTSSTEAMRLDDGYSVSAPNAQWTTLFDVGVKLSAGSTAIVTVYASSGSGLGMATLLLIRDGYGAQTFTELGSQPTGAYLEFRLNPSNLAQLQVKPVISSGNHTIKGKLLIIKS
jgi:hypothetical protein